MLTLTPKPLTAEAFQPYGDVIEMEKADSFEINYGLTRRYHNLANIDVSDKQGKAGFSIFKAQATKLPHHVKVMEYHPLGSQLFYPICNAPFLVLLAPPSKEINIDRLELFITNGSQGVNYNKGTWHHYLMPLNKTSDFIVIDRICNDNNCIEQELRDEIIIQLNEEQEQRL